MEAKRDENIITCMTSTRLRSLQNTNLGGKLGKSAFIPIIRLNITTPQMKLNNLRIVKGWPSTKNAY